MTEEVLTRDLSSGRIHRRYLTESGALASIEADNLDDAGAYEVIDPKAVEDADPADLCRNCFAQPKQDGQMA